MGPFWYLSIYPEETRGRHYVSKTVDRFTKNATKVCLDVVSNYNVRSKNSKILSTGQDIVN